MTIVIRIDCPARNAQGMKEMIAMRLEDLGGVRVMEVREEPTKQTSLWKEDKP